MNIIVVVVLLCGISSMCVLVVCVGGGGREWGGEVCGGKGVVIMGEGWEVFPSEGFRAGGCRPQQGWRPPML